MSSQLQLPIMPQRWAIEPTSQSRRRRLGWEKRRGEEEEEEEEEGGKTADQKLTSWKS
jgi:hypothetical protein